MRYLERLCQENDFWRLRAVVSREPEILLDARPKKKNTGLKGLENLGRRTVSCPPLPFRFGPVCWGDSQPQQTRPIGGRPLAQRLPSSVRQPNVIRLAEMTGSILADRGWGKPPLCGLLRTGLPFYRVSTNCNPRVPKDKSMASSFHRLPQIIAVLALAVRNTGHLQLNNLSNPAARSP